MPCSIGLCQRAVQRAVQWAQFEEGSQVSDRLMAVPLSHGLDRQAKTFDTAFDLSYSSPSRSPQLHSGLIPV